MPKRIYFKFITPVYGAGDIIEKVNIEPNNVNFTMSFYYSVKSKDLHVTSVTDFESYKYCTEIIQMQEILEEKCFYEDGIGFCVEFFVYREDEPRILLPKREKIVPGKAFIEESIIHESNL